MSDYPYVWHWRTCQDPNKPPGKRMPHVYANRCGQRLRVIARSTSMNSALVEFEDGHRSVISRNALQKAAA